MKLPLRFRKNIYTVLVLAALPFSFFLLSVAFGQGIFINFCKWLSLSCLTAGLPFLAALNQFQAPVSSDYLQYFSLKLRKQSIASIPKYGEHKDWMWRGWKIRYASILNSSSSVHVLLLHGFGGSIGHWRQNIIELSKHHNVHAIDLLGFGASEKPVTSYTIELWAAQVYEFWTTFINEPIVLVGNSIGAVTCLEIAANYPEMARGVVMISLPHTTHASKERSGLFRLVGNGLKTLLLSPFILQPIFYLLRQPWVVRHWASLAYTCKEAISDELLEILVSPAREQGAAKAFCAIFQAMLSPQFSPNIPSILRNLKLPSLLMWGKKDRMIPFNLAKQLLEYSSTLQLLALENAGHCAHDECPERVNQELLNWIDMQILTV
jgi:pimeloyl-ACP methyl ester carboxylesterase